jgi:Holliday junction resolvase RusA-like endonuclease
MNLITEIRIPGEPAPGGSKTAIPAMRDGKPVYKNGRQIIHMVDAGKHNKRWKKAVAACGRQVWVGRDPLDEPLAVEFIFRYERPDYHFNAHGGLTKKAKERPTGPPDTTKLIRSTEDALTEIIWKDDSRIVEQIGRKIWADTNDPRDVYTTVKVYRMRAEEQLTFAMFAGQEAA